MNGSSAVNERLIGKFHVVNLDRVVTNPNCEEIQVNSNDESNNGSRFQMIRVDRNFGRGRWKVNDYEPPEMNNAIPTVSSIENEINTLAMIPNESNVPPATVVAAATVPLPVTAPLIANPTAAVAAAPTFQQQRLSINNTPMVLSHGNVPSPAGLLHAYPPGALANLTTPNQSYLLANHPQFGYYPIYPPPYPAAFAAQWAALAAANPYLPPPPMVSSLPTQAAAVATTLNDPLRLTETDMNSDNATIPNNEHLSNGAVATTPFLYAPRHSHSPYVPQHSGSSTSPYATIPSYHPVAALPTIIPPKQCQPISQANLSNSSDILQSQGTFSSSQQAPLVASPKTLIQHPALIITPKVKPPMNNPQITTTTMTTSTNITDLISTSPSLTTSQQAPVSLLSPIPTTTSTSTNPSTTNLTDIWNYTNSNSPLNFGQTAAAMGIFNNENNSNTGITNEILKELTTPTKQNNLTDIDNKISAAMDLVKMHLLSAVREEVTEIREQIRLLHEKITCLEHENTYLRQHVSSEIYAQYIPLLVNHHSSSHDSSHLSIPLPSLSSSQTIPISCPASLPSTLVQQAS